MSIQQIILRAFSLHNGNAIFETVGHIKGQGNLGYAANTNKERVLFKVTEHNLVVTISNELDMITGTFLIDDTCADTELAWRILLCKVNCFLQANSEVLD